MHLVKKKKHQFRKENMMEAIKNVRKSEIEQIKKKKRNKSKLCTGQAVLNLLQHVKDFLLTTPDDKEKITN